MMNSLGSDCHCTKVRSKHFAYICCQVGEKTASARCKQCEPDSVQHRLRGKASLSLFFVDFWTFEVCDLNYKKIY